VSGCVVGRHKRKGWGHAPNRDFLCASCVRGFKSSVLISGPLTGGSAQGIQGQKRLHTPHFDSSSLLFRHLHQPQQKHMHVHPPTKHTAARDIRIMASCTGTAGRRGAGAQRTG